MKPMFNKVISPKSPSLLSVSDEKGMPACIDVFRENCRIVCAFEKDRFVSALRAPGLLKELSETLNSMGASRSLRDVRMYMFPNPRKSTAPEDLPRGKTNEKMIDYEDVRMLATSAREKGAG